MNTALRWLLVLCFGAPVLMVIALSGAESPVDPSDPGAALCLAFAGALLGGVAYYFATGADSGWLDSDD